MRNIFLLVSLVSQENSLERIVGDNSLSLGQASCVCIPNHLQAVLAQSLEPCGVMLRGECWGKLVLGAWCRQAVLCGNRGLTETEIKGK